jgi:threonine/homoserine/homoserine lactone efflux protein
MSIAFLLTTLVVVATPGTGALYTIAAGLSRGRLSNTQVLRRRLPAVSCLADFSR